MPFNPSYQMIPLIKNLPIRRFALLALVPAVLSGCETREQASSESDWYPDYREANIKSCERALRSLGNPQSPSREACACIWDNRFSTLTEEQKVIIGKYLTEPELLGQQDFMSLEQALDIAFPDEAEMARECPMVFELKTKP